MVKDTTVKGTIEINDNGWIWIPDSLKKNDAKQLARDIKFVHGVNPSSAIAFMRHLPKASGCAEHLQDPDRHAKCVINMNKL